ncbi:SKP1-like protein 1B isoform X1 [Cinnamomum micranthum f. kanehirae]|uniref:SKP1-like protein 1B isoform X1 n=1 Tax=Cinnamomum micranthum f. kanehirae TaxID=337451 RepID=A0A3S3NW77_9MAGN|nr:SKP1-like protein 1B isoform X1 [Cinnamomum micranthum f. kanehirae]
MERDREMDMMRGRGDEVAWEMEKWGILRLGLGDDETKYGLKKKRDNPRFEISNFKFLCLKQLKELLDLSLSLSQDSKKGLFGSLRSPGCPIYHQPGKGRDKERWGGRNREKGERKQWGREREEKDRLALSIPDPKVKGKVGGEKRRGWAKRDENVENYVARESKIISNMMEGDCANNVIPIRNVMASILSKMIKWCKKHAQMKEDNNNNNNNNNNNEEKEKELRS